MIKETGRHLVFYDGECGLCDRSVQFLLKHDKDRIFDFAPLQGETAALWLVSGEKNAAFPAEDSVVLIENYKTAPRMHLLSRAVFRSLLLLGGWWKIPGSLYYLPSFFFNGAYRWVAATAIASSHRINASFPTRKIGRVTCRSN